MNASIRADKWLWATRFFKTRVLAARSLDEGKVKRNGAVLKPASAVQAADVLEIPFVEGPGRREILVIKVIDKRAGAPEARECYEERTKEEVFEAQKLWHYNRAQAAKGRPTKRDRRAIDQIHEDWEQRL